MWSSLFIRLVVWSSSSWLSARSPCWSSSSTSRNVRMQWHLGWPEENQKLLIEIIFIWLCHKSQQSLVFLSKFQNAHKVTKRGRSSAMVTTYISISQHPDMGLGFSGMDGFTQKPNEKQIPVLVCCNSDFFEMHCFCSVVSKCPTVMLRNQFMKQHCIFENLNYWPLETSLVLMCYINMKWLH